MCLRGVRPCGKWSFFNLGNCRTSRVPMCELSFLRASFLTVAGLTVSAATVWFVLVQIVYQKRRTDIDLAARMIESVREMQFLALDRLAGMPIDLGRVWRLGQFAIDRTGIEMSHRREDVQVQLLAMLNTFLKIADCADGREKMTPDEVIKTSHEVVEDLLVIIRALTFLETLRQAYAIPGPIKISRQTFKPLPTQDRIDPQL